MSYSYIVDALVELAPEAEWTVSNSGSVSDIVWHTDGQKPTNSEIEEKRLQIISEQPIRLLREKRNKLLAETDWWASSDLTMTQAQTDYRQALRDITDNATSLDDVTWPTKP